MKKKLLICLLLTVICFWHFNVKAEGIADAITEDAVASEVISNEEIVGTESETEEESDEESDDETEEESELETDEETGTDEEELVEEKEEETTDETEKEEEITEEEVTTTDDVEEENNEEGNNEEENNIEVVNENNVLTDIYQVTFIYGNNGLKMLGGTSINLSDLIRKLGMEISVSDITSVSISNNELLSIVSIDGTNDYVIKSLKMFDTEETLTITTSSGDTYSIKVLDPPDHLKAITYNDDGTYKLSLDVTGESETKVETASNVNVLIVYDVSSSMTSNRVGNGNSSPRRADQAEKVVYDFVKALAEYQNTNHDNIKIALVTFARKAATRVSWTTNFDNITEILSSTGNNNSARLNYSTNGTGINNNTNGTNWEAAMGQAETVLGQLPQSDKDVPTFVIFVTDGAPTSNGDGTNAINPSGATLNQLRPYYNSARENAEDVQTYKTPGSENDNTTMYGIYAYGREADLLDDLIYYSLNGQDRTNVRVETDATDNYYNASDTTQLKNAVTSIFQKIVQALGVGSVSITDGTTSTVVSENAVSHLLDVDDKSFEYWLTVPIVNNEFKRVDLVSGDEITYIVSDNGDGTLTITWNSGSVDVTGSLEINKFKYKWTEANALYNVAPPVAKFENDAVKWDLTNVGTLLNGVTYTVTFDVWPSQETLDLIADLKNDPSKYDDLDDGIKQYLVRSGEEGSYSYTLLTNTNTALSYVDTRDDGYGSGSTTFNRIDPVSTSATQMLTITKEWNNDIDSREKREVKIDVLRDGKSWNTLTLNDDNDYEVSTNIAVGIMTVKDGVIDIKAEGHDFSFGELGKEAYNWELKSEVVRPMLINGDLTILIRKGTEVPTEDVYYKIGDYYYVVGKLTTEGVAELVATNERRSWIDLEKTLNYDDKAAHFDDTIFTFDITVGEEGGEDIWFSVFDKAASAIVKLADNLGLTVTGAEEEVDEETGEVTGYFYAPSGSTFTVGIKTGWSLRLLNLLTGTTYTITETNIDSKFEFEDITYTETTDVNGNAYIPTVNKTNYSVSGEIQKTNTKYGYTFINKNVNTEIVVTKVWEDNDDVNKNRPSNIVLNLSDGTKVIAQPTKVENENGTWTYTYTGLPVYDENEKLIEYKLTEDAITGYTTVITGDAKEGFTVTNTLETTSVTVNKDWQDNNNQDGLRPTTITLTLSNGDTVELTKEGNWTATVNNLPKYKNGSLVTYTVTEETVPEGYQVTYSEDGLTAINTHTPDTKKLVVKKVWDDNSNQDGKRPGSVTFTVTGSDGNEYTATLSGNGNEWTATIEKVAVYYDGGKTVTFEVTEDTVAGYTPSIDNEKLTITNSYTPEKADVVVTKVWDDSSNKEGLRPEKITIHLLANGEEVSATPTIAKDGNTWTFTYSKLDVNAGGSAIEYTVTEDTVTNYETDIDNEKLIITNSRKVEEVEVNVQKVWEDENNAEGFRPDEVIVNLLANGKVIDTVTLSEDNEWEYSWTKLDKYANGSEIKYTVTEDEVDNYETDIEYNEDDDAYIITNTHEVVRTSVTVKKIWVDDNDRDGVRPKKLVITIMKTIDGLSEKVKDIELNDGNKWTETIKDLLKYENGKEVTYTAVENDVPKGYEEGYSEDTFTITNTHEIETNDIVVTKVWEDSDNESDKRPDKVTIILLANGKDYDTIVLSEENNWTHTFEGVPVNDEDHKEITYSVTEEDVPEGYEVAYEETSDGFIIHNALGQGDGEPPKNPQTGSNIVLYLVTLLISIIGLVSGKLYLKENN